MKKTHLQVHTPVHADAVSQNAISTTRTHINPAKITRSDEMLILQQGFKLGRTLGHGAFSKVLLAYCKDQNDLDEYGKHKIAQYACKYINGEEAQLEFYSKFFPREIAVMEKVMHESCVRIYKIFQRRLRFYVFMTYCENGDLLDFIRNNGAVVENQAHFWFCQILRGLQYLMNLGVCHRDLKPDNLLLTKGYNIKISDFGFARRLMDNDLSKTFCGSLAYTPPEIIHGDPYDPIYSDVWSAGVVLYVMLNKHMPFDYTNVNILYDSQINRSWKLRSKVSAVASKDLPDFLSLMLDPEPKRRPVPWELWKHPWIQNGGSPSVEPELAHDKIDVDWDTEVGVEPLNADANKNKEKMEKS